MGEIKLDNAVEKIVGDHLIQVPLWNTSKSLRIYKFLISSALKPLANVAKGDGVDISGFTEALSDVLNSLEEKQFEKLLKDCCEGLVIDGRELDFEKQFRGKLFLLHEVILAVLEVQYSDFLDALKEKAPTVMKSLRK